MKKRFRNIDRWLDRWLGVIPSYSKKQCRAPLGTAFFVSLRSNMRPKTGALAGNVKRFY